jgi:hypothetical protein
MEKGRQRPSDTVNASFSFLTAREQLEDFDATRKGRPALLSVIVPPHAGSLSSTWAYSSTLHANEKRAS